VLGSTQTAPHTISGETQPTVPLALEALELLEELVTPLLELDAALLLEELVTPLLELAALLEELVTPLLELDVLLELAALETLVAPLPEPEVLVVSPLELEALVAPPPELEEVPMDSSMRPPQLTLTRSEAATQSVTTRAVVRHREGSTGRAS
jgi:hypothetical protein